MLRSMTAYGCGTSHSDEKSVFLELISLNRKFLDIHISLSDELCFLDPFLRKWIQERISRGNITLRLKCKSSCPKQFIDPNFLVSSSNWMRALKSLSDQLGLKISDDFLFESVVTRATQELKEENTLHQEEFLGLVKEAFYLAMDALDEMKRGEGLSIFESLASSVSSLLSYVKKMETMRESIAKLQRERLKKRFDELELQSVEDKSRFFKELSLLIDKLDITEELNRLLSHTRLLDDLLKKGGAVGKQFDFLLQEVLRECNTLSAKAQDSAMTEEVVLAKCEVEKMREQIQNVE